MRRCKLETNRPSLNWINEADQEQISIEFGYFRNEPTAALIYKESLILIPRDVLQIAFEQGWEMECPYDHDHDEVPA